MILLAIAYFVVFALPLLLGSWRAQVASLGAQALLLAAAALRDAHEPGRAFEVLELGLVRGLLVPAFLLHAGRAGVSGRLEVLPGDLLHWALALALVAASATFASAVSAADLPRAAGIAAAGAEVLIALLILATRTEPLAQAIGALCLENGVVFVDARAAHRLEAPVRLGVAIAFVGLVLQLGWLLGRLAEARETPAAPDGPGVAEGQVL